jgi:hypothetical protein
MCSPSTEQFSTISEFYAAAKKVVIDSTFSFEVRPNSNVRDDADIFRTQRKLMSVWKVLGALAKLLLKLRRPIRSIEVHMHGFRAV